MFSMQKHTEQTQQQKALLSLLSVLTVYSCRILLICVRHWSSLRLWSTSRLPRSFLHIWNGTL